MKNKKWQPVAVVEDTLVDWELIIEPSFRVLRPFGKGKVGRVYIPAPVLEKLGLQDGDSIDITIRKHKEEETT